MATRWYDHSVLNPLLALLPVWSSALIALSVATTVAQSKDLSRHPFHQEVPTPQERLKGPASKFANFSQGECRKQLSLTGEFKEAFGQVGSQNGVATPLRFVAPLGGVTFQVPPPKVNFGILDCRQALLWIQLLPVLEKHNIAKIRIDNFYRNHARLGRGKKSQHAYGLAADVVSITLKDGRELSVPEDFLGRRGEVPCGPEAAIWRRPTSTDEQVERAILLRNFVCELGRMGAFHHILTPNYNKAHESHLHMDLKRDNKWFSLE